MYNQFPLTSVTIPVERLFSLGLRLVVDLVRGCIDGDVLLESSLQAEAEGMDFDLEWDLCDVSVEVGVADEVEGAKEEEVDLAENEGST